MAVQVSGIVSAARALALTCSLGVFLLDLLRKGEGILADPLPSESPLGSVDTLVFFPGSSALAGGLTST